MRARLIYGVSIVLSSFLMFDIQPLMGKILLPRFGGAAGVWASCLLFFQIGLLAGYVYAHQLVRRIPFRWQKGVHAVLVTLSMATLPFSWSVRTGQVSLDSPLLYLLGYLGITIGIPYMLLAGTPPLLQSWYSSRRDAGTPYGLYSFSNFGSLMGLLCYPVLIEPFFSITQQLGMWSLLYAMFFLGCLYIAGGSRSWGPEASSVKIGARVMALPGHRIVLWLSLPACTTALLMSTTGHITKNIAPIPLLWVIPLGLYLLSFMLCFAADGKYYRRRIYYPALIAALGTMSVFLVGNIMDLLLSITVFTAGLFVCCMVCHGELYRLRPDPEQLTTYYLTIASGGALGGLSVLAIAPYVFSGYYELNLAIGACALLALVCAWDTASFKNNRRMWGSGLAAVFVLLVILGHNIWWQQLVNKISVRNFFGPLYITETRGSDRADDRRELLHAGVAHGSQFTDSSRRLTPTTYYGHASGAGIVLDSLRLRPASFRAGVVGLGVGTLAAYGRTGDYFRFYEINPLVYDLARTEFSFLRDTPSRWDVVLADGRLALEREEDQHLDLLVVDAFSGDAIPTHLLTREAFEVYLRHLNRDGVLAFHITNWYLDLEYIVERMARLFGKEAVLVEQRDSPSEDVRFARWVLVMDSEGGGTSLLGNRKYSTIAPRGDLRPWTDDYSNVFGILRVQGKAKTS